MIQQALGDSLTIFAVVGLLLFFATFVGIALWTLSRKAKQIDNWSSLPLVDGTEPLEPRLPIVDSADGVSHHEGGCGKCEDCDCEKHEPAGV